MDPDVTGDHHQNFQRVKVIEVCRALALSLVLKEGLVLPLSLAVGTLSPPPPPLPKGALRHFVHFPPTSPFSTQSKSVRELVTFLLVLSFSFDFFFARGCPTLPEDLLLAYTLTEIHFQETLVAAF